MPQHALSTLVFFAVASAAICAEPPLRLAVQARFDLAADEAVGGLTDARIERGHGALERMVWLPEAEHPRSYMVNFPINPLAWRSLAVRFTPTGAGKVTLTLTSPWEEARAGQIYKQEVFWDAVSAEGAVLANGSFEDAADGKPTGWHTAGATVEMAKSSFSAKEGRRVLRSWQKAPASIELDVMAGVPVLLRMSARSVLTPDAPRPPRDPPRATPAHAAARKFLRGVNLSNYLEAPPGQDWGARYDASDFEAIRREGFDHVRIPVAWHHHTGPAPDFAIEESFLAKADFLVRTAGEHGRAAIVNIHHFDAFTTDPPGQRKKFLAIWRQLAEHYAKLPASVAFELINEPKDAATSEAIGPIYAETIREIRRTNPRRTIFVGPGQWNQAGQLWRLPLPADELNLIATVHNYDPFPFTHQGAGWAGPDQRTTGVLFPGPPDSPLSGAQPLSAGAGEWLAQYNGLPTAVNPSNLRSLASAIEEARLWSESFGRPVHWGEFGCYTAAPAESRVRYYRQCRESLEAAGIGWAVWDWKAGFRYWDGQRRAPVAGMREALFK